MIGKQEETAGITAVPSTSPSSPWLRVSPKGLGASFRAE